MSRERNIPGPRVHDNDSEWSLCNQTQIHKVQLHTLKWLILQLRHAAHTIMFTFDTAESCCDGNLCGVDDCMRVATCC